VHRFCCAGSPTPQDGSQSHEGAERLPEQLGNSYYCTKPIEGYRSKIRKNRRICETPSWYEEINKFFVLIETNLNETLGIWKEKRELMTDF
jgi:hypothetical protein